MNALTSFGQRRAPSRKHAGSLQDLVRTAKLEDLFAKRFDLLSLRRRGQIRSQTFVRLDLTHVPPQRLRRDAEIPGDLRDRPTGLEHQPGTALQQLLWVLPGT